MGPTLPDTRVQVPAVGLLKNMGDETPDAEQVMAPPSGPPVVDTVMGEEIAAPAIRAGVGHVMPLGASAAPRWVKGRRARTHTQRGAALATTRLGQRRHAHRAPRRRWWMLCWQRRRLWRTTPQLTVYAPVPGKPERTHAVPSELGVATSDPAASVWAEEHPVSVAPAGRAAAADGVGSDGADAALGTRTCASTGATLGHAVDGHTGGMQSECGQIHMKQNPPRPKSVTQRVRR